MRYAMALVLMSIVGANVRAATFVYVSKSAEQQIQIYRLNEEDGSLVATATIAVEGAPGALTVDATRRFLFASLRSTSSLASFRIDPATGGLTLLGRTQLPQGENAAYVRPDPSGKWLVSASYTAGKVVVHALADGVIGSPLDTIATARTAHFVAFDRTNTWAFVPHVAPNAVYQFRFEPATGRLTPSAQARGGAPGAGPRHLAWHPGGELAFTSDETGSSITAYRFDPANGLSPVQTLSTLPVGFTAKNTTAEVKVHPSGKFVWVSNRGHDSLAGFALDPAGGLVPLGQTPTEATPRSFDIDASGKFLFGAGEGSGKLAVFAVDQETGKLERKHTYDVGKSLPWVLAVEMSDGS
jgi:6-phosphogluconolactonase